jgi:DNA-binding transcriptional LysR family regulator
MRIHSAALKYFDAVRRAGSIRGGARQLNIASSAVNRQILKLEEEIDAQLFERLSDGLKLTEAGELFARHVTTVLQDASRFEDEITLFKGGGRGEIGVLAVEGLTHDFLPKIIAKMLRKHPYVKFKVQTVGSQIIPKILSDGESDVGIAFAISSTPEIEQLAYGHFHIGAIMRLDHPLADKSEIALLDALEFPWILGNENLSIRPLLEPTLRNLGQSAPTIIETSSLELMKQLALRGLGITFQSVFGFEGDLKAKKLIHIPVAHNGPIYRDLSIQVRKGRVPSASTQEFINLATDELALREQADRSE